MNEQTLRNLIEYFDLKQFFTDNSPFRLALILGIMCLLFLGAKFLCAILQKKIEKYISAKTGIPATNKGLENTLGLMDFSMFERVIKNVRLLLYLMVIYWGLSRLVINAVFAEVVKVLFTTLCIWACIEFFVAFIPFNLDIYLRRRGATLKTSQSRSLMPIIKGVVWAIGLTFLLDNLGFHVSTIIAGLGIVGVAVGLAGQAILADFFSYIVILLDKPFRIGDYVELGDGKGGDVEYMGPKTTHLRNLNDDLIVCANSEMTKGVLINQGSIHERIVILNFGVAYDTPVEKLKNMSNMLRDLINAFPQCTFDRACMLEFGSSNLNFQVIYKVSQQRGGIRDFMITRSDVNIAILDRFNKEDITMAYPTENVLFTDLDKQQAPAATPESASVAKEQAQAGK